MASQALVERVPLGFSTKESSVKRWTSYKFGAEMAVYAFFKKVSSLITFPFLVEVKVSTFQLERNESR